MKKLLTIMLVVIVAIGSMATFSSCTTNSYSITYTVDGTVVTTGTPKSYKESDEVINLWVPDAKDGLIFDGWYLNKDCTGAKWNEISANTIGNREYYGRFIKSSYTIRYMLDGVEDTSATSKSYSVSSNPVTLWSPTEPSGKLFDGWYENNNYTGIMTTQLPGNSIGDKTYYGRFITNNDETINYSITYFFEGVEQTECAPISYRFSATNPVALWIPVIADLKVHKFSGWYESDSFSGTPITELSANITGNKVFYGRYVAPDGHGNGRKKASDFTLYDENGDITTKTLSSFYGKKPVVINIWGTWCNPCKIEMPYFQELYMEMGDKIEFMMVNGLYNGDTATKVSEFISTNKYTFPVYLDVGMPITRLYLEGGYPTSIFIDKWGYVTFSIASTLEKSRIKSELQKAIDAAK